MADSDPTPRELEALEVLGSAGEVATVREVADDLQRLELETTLNRLREQVAESEE